MYTRCMTLHLGCCHARADLPAVELLARGKPAADVVTTPVAARNEAPEVLLADRRK